MIRISFACALLALSTIASQSFAATVLQGPVINPANGHSYYLLGPDTWTGAEATALGLGGHLTTINNLAENSWVYDTFMPTAQHNLWIGLYDPSQDQAGGIHSAHFVWADGDAASYRNWASGEPNNNTANEWYTLMQYQTFNVVQPTEWNDVQNVQGDTHAVAEVVPEPWCISALLPACAALILRRGSGLVA